ncbi:MAG: TonB-dependent receptor [Mangrovibacterium sp.]
MRLFSLFMLVGTLTVSAKSWSQQTKIDLQVQNSSVRDILLSIENKSRYLFIYDADVVNSLGNRSILVRGEGIEEVLKQLFEGTNVTYRIQERQVFLFAKDTFVSAFQAGQETLKIKGKVTDSSGAPLPGVTIQVKNTSKGIITSADGSYTLSNVPTDATLVFSFVGMITQEIAVAGKTSIDILMQEETLGIEEVVAIGYGIQKKTTLTGSVTTVKAGELATVPASKLSNVLAGRLSGVYVSQSTGVPGTTSDIRVRSSASWNASTPVYVIDGVVRDKHSFDMLDANEVEDITVLKDAASAAIYGSRSANGVILVTTKSGRVGKSTITFSTNYSFETPTSRSDKLDAYTSGLLNNEYWQKQTATNWFGEDELDELKKTGGYNYLDELYQTPSSRNHTVNAEGGNEKIKYYIGGSYLDQGGFLPSLDYSKYNLRSNIDASITDDLTVGLQLSTVYGKKKTFNSGNTDLSDWYGKLDHFFFYVPIRINGNLVNPGWIGSMVGLIEEGGYNKVDEADIDAQLRVDYKIPFIKGLSVKGIYSKNIATNYTKTYYIQPTLYNYKTTGSTGKIWTDELLSVVKAPYPARESLSNTHIRSNSYQFNVQLLYARMFGKHNIDATAVFEQYDGSNIDFNLTRYDFPLLNKDQFYATSSNAEDSYGSGSESYNGRKSFIGRASYQFNEKYLFSASLRADGSMLFAPGKRWGYFPSVSVGWRLSEEEFFKERFSIFNQFKLRASLGYTGNDAVGGWQWQEAYYPSSDFYFGNSNQKAIRYGGIVNKDLTWEKSRSTNFGLDIATISNIGMSLDFWQRHTYDILGSRVLSLPTTFGGSMPSENYGKMNSYGFEIELNYHNNIGELSYEVQGNFSYATTKVKLADVAEGALDVDNPNGKTLGYTATYISTGIIRTQAELDQLPEGYTIFGAKPALGHLNYEDISGIDGQPDGKIDGYDRKIISNYSQGTAPYSAGLNLNLAWKGFTLNTFFQSTFGYQKLYNDNWSRGFPLDARVYAFWNDHWTPDNVDGKYPAMQAPGEPSSSTPSTFWYENGGYIRLKNLSLGYNLPQKWLEKIKIQQTRIYINGTNLFYLSSFGWYDPEISSLASYPNMKTWNLGLSITL